MLLLLLLLLFVAARPGAPLFHPQRVQPEGRDGRDKVG
jgi:hypothetical protein